MNESDRIISAADTDRFLSEILTAAGSEGLGEDEIAKAYDQFTDWHLTAAMVMMWTRRQITLRWDAAQQDLVVVMVDGHIGR